MLEKTASSPVSVNEYLRELASRLKSAVNLKDGRFDFQECLNVAAEIERLPTKIGAAEEANEDLNPLKLGVLLGIKQLSAARILAYLLRYPDTIHSHEVLAARLGFSPRSVVVYMSHLRSALAKIGMRHLVRVSYKSGYFIMIEDATQFREMIAVKDDAKAA